MAAETERQKQMQAAATERQRIAKEQADKKRADELAAAEAKRVADQKAADETREAQRVAKLLPLLQPLKSPGGASIITAAGQPFGTLLLEAQVDEVALTAKGKGIDLSQMPFQEFTYEGGFEATGNQQGQLLLRTSIAKDPIAFYTANPTGLAGSVRGVSLITLAAGDRPRWEKAIATGKRLQAARPLDLAIEPLEADAAKTKEGALKPMALSGSIIYRDKLTPTLAPLFSGNLTGRKGYSWKANETVAIRLDEPVKGSGLYIRGTGGQGGGLAVVINGVHHAKVESIPKNGGVFIVLPADFEIMELRFQASGTVASRGIALIP